ARAGADHVDHYPWVESGSFGEQHSFCSGDIVDCNQVVGNKLHPAAISIAPEISGLLGKISKQAHTFLDHFTIAAGIDYEVPKLCLSAGSAERTIERDVPGLPEHRFEAKLVGKAKRAELYDDP